MYTEEKKKIKLQLLCVLPATRLSPDTPASPLNLTLPSRCGEMNKKIIWKALVVLWAFSPNPRVWTVMAEFIFKFVEAV